MLLATGVTRTLNRHSLRCGCKIERVAPDSFVVGLCELHEAYPTWLSGLVEYERALVVHRSDCEDDDCSGECGEA